MAAPPVCQALFLSFQVSDPGSPGGHRVFSPQHLAGRAIERSDEIAHAAVAPGGADDDLVLDRKRRRGELQVRLSVAEIGFPGGFARLLVGGDDAGRIVRDADDEIAPQRDAAIGERRLLLPRVHAPHDPTDIARATIDLVDDAPLIDDVEEAVLRERCRLEVLVRRGAPIATA
jgi:hypothetical protein